jgi:hypothetical protein
LLKFMFGEVCQPITAALPVQVNHWFLLTCLMFIYYF